MTGHQAGEDDGDPSFVSFREELDRGARRIKLSVLVFVTVAIVTFLLYLLARYAAS